MPELVPSPAVFSRLVFNWANGDGGEGTVLVVTGLLLPEWARMHACVRIQKLQLQITPKR